MKRVFKEVPEAVGENVSRCADRLSVGVTKSGVLLVLSLEAMRDLLKRFGKHLSAATLDTVQMRTLPGVSGAVE